jgi:hypothetical protein
MNLPGKKPTVGPYQERYCNSEKRPSNKYHKDGKSWGPIKPPAKINTV